MPLLPGKKKVGHNISELIHAYREKGSIGTSHPESPEKARKQAIAISLKKAGLSRVKK